MDQKQLERLLDSMGISYTHTACKPTQQLPESRGRYTMTGDWVEEETIFHTLPSGVKVLDIASSPEICEYCDILVDKQPIIHLQCKVNRFKSTDWKVKCQECRKEIDFIDFKATIKSDDK